MLGVPLKLCAPSAPRICPAPELRTRSVRAWRQAPEEGGVGGGR